METTNERIAFVQRRIAEYREVAKGFRASAVGNTVERASQCLEQAKLAEAMATAQERVLSVLFDIQPSKKEG